WAPGKQEHARGAYWKLVESGFDAVPALLAHVEDERLTRYEHTIFNVKFGPVGTERVRVRHVVGQILNDLSGRELVPKAGPRWVEAAAARAWWEKARKEGEEKWLVAHAVPEFESDDRSANRVIFRLLGTKYPARLGAFYQTVLRKHPQRGSRALADEIATSK